MTVDQHNGTTVFPNVFKLAGATTRGSLGIPRLTIYPSLHYTASGVWCSVDNPNGLAEPDAPNGGTVFVLPCWHRINAKVASPVFSLLASVEGTTVCLAIPHLGDHRALMKEIAGGT